MKFITGIYQIKLLNTGNLQIWKVQYLLTEQLVKISEKYLNIISSYRQIKSS